MELVKYLIIIGTILVLLIYGVDFYYTNDVTSMLEDAARAEIAGNHPKSDLILQKLRSSYGKNCVDFLLKIIHDKKQKTILRQLAQQLLDSFKSEYHKGRTIDRTTRTILAALEVDVSINASSLDFVKCVDYAKSNDCVVRLAAAKRLGALKKKDGIRHLEKLLEDDYWKVRVEAARSLVLLEAKSAIDKLVALTEDPVVEVTKAALICLGKLGKISNSDKAFKTLVSKLSEEFAAAATGLGHLQDSRAVAELKKHLRHQNHYSRISAARALVQLNSPEGYKFLRNECRTADEPYRKAAALALGVRQSDEAVKILAEAMSDVSAVVRAAAAKGLGSQRGPSAIAALKAGLTDKDTTVVQASLLSLGYQKETRVLTILEEYLQRGRSEEICAAIEANVIAENEGAVKILEKLLKSDYRNIQTSAWRALRRLTGRDYEVDMEN